jgi:hypothetical protein
VSKDVFYLQCCNVNRLNADHPNANRPNADCPNANRWNVPGMPGIPLYLAFWRFYNIGGIWAVGIRAVGIWAVGIRAVGIQAAGIRAVGIWAVIIPAAGN